jgi:hypothetical protein
MRRSSPWTIPAAIFLALALSAGWSATRAHAQDGGTTTAEPSEPPAPSAPSPAAPAPAATQDAGLQARAQSFYAFLRGRQVNIHSLFQNETFRSYFSAEDVLENYIAYLTSRLGEHRFRKYRIERTELEGLKPAGPERATARVKLIGRHRDTLIFWDQNFKIEDDWRLVEGEWYVFPPPF